jgi:hypothetical protein
MNVCEYNRTLESNEEKEETICWAEQKGRRRTRSCSLIYLKGYNEIPGMYEGSRMSGLPMTNTGC